ncbi:hypothetical protein NUW54_g14298 [Trametes sanguinea]|uniref:Uncharacterized protein n=1 Tax=Trametes sanguinea TaxID=158606 RepID=A0ACC1MFC5_9APHY|nr:hypothetical protein NUW54_g14298 [Trametes sanguinea]
MVVAQLPCRPQKEMYLMLAQAHSNLLQESSAPAQSSKSRRAPVISQNTSASYRRRRIRYCTRHTRLERARQVIMPAEAELSRYSGIFLSDVEAAYDVRIFVRTRLRQWS